MKLWEKFKQLGSVEKVTLIAAIIGATGSILASFIGISASKQLAEYKIVLDTYTNTINSIDMKISNISNNNNNANSNNNENSNINVNGNNNVNSNNTNSNINSNNVVNYEAEKTIKSLMEEAIHAYDAEEYLRVIELYSNEKISNTPIVLTNLGFLYENGYGVTQDFNKAIEYYNRAISQDYEPAYEHKLAMYIKYKLQKIEEIICEGYDLGNKRAALYIANFCDSEMSDKDALYTYCKIFSKEQQLDFNQRFYTYTSRGVQSFSSPRVNDDFYLYVPISQKTSLYNEISMINYYYHVYKCIPLDLDILNPTFVKEEFF